MFPTLQVQPPFSSKQFFLKKCFYEDDTHSSSARGKKTLLNNFIYHDDGDLPLRSLFTTLFPRQKSDCFPSFSLSSRGCQGGTLSVGVERRVITVPEVSSSLHLSTLFPPDLFFFPGVCYHLSLSGRLLLWGYWRAMCRRIIVTCFIFSWWVLGVLVMFVCLRFCLW